MAIVAAGSTPASDETSVAATLVQGSVSFELDVLPILSAAGCNAGACHGKSRGQNGFALSLLAFDPQLDYSSIALEGRGRRVSPAAPDNSLILRKASLSVPHGGGLRLKPGSAEYETVRRWIAAGVPRTPAEAPTLKRIEVQPRERILTPGETLQLTVLAHYSDGSIRDVTRLTDFQVNEPGVLSLSAGKITAGQSAGEATLMIRYMNNVATWNAAIPLAGSVDAQLYEALPRANFIDGLVWDKLRSQGITPSQPAGDSTYLRRVYLDIIGRLPSADEVRAFLTSTSPARREELVDALLARGEYADYWANKWADLLRPNPYRVGIKPTMAFDAWIRERFRENIPYDQFVRQLLTAQGSAWRNGAATWFRDRRTPDEIIPVVSQLFLGIRLECAKCHHHPFEIWSQDDFYSLAAYFARVTHKGQGISPPISGGEETIFVAESGHVTHPISGKVLEPRPLFGTARPIAPGEDPRAALADWIASPQNPYFAQVAVSRVWADLMGRGLVEPVDDLRATNPASNPALLSALADDFREQGYDLKKLIRRIVTSCVYGLSSAPNERNVADTRNYARHYRTRLRAEVLLDAVSDITGVPEQFAGMPPGTRSVEIWTHRVDSLFLDAFGRPDANQDPPYERAADSTIVQALHLMNAPDLHKKVTADTGRAATLAASGKESTQIVEELYLSVYSRFPTDEERQAVTTAFVANPNRRQATEDLMWALINTPEFMFKD
ncbi:MAG TPA: DUF1549 and DUF1553 domain-containing protein [Pirellulales bacterium]|jgi:hypothetical protein|nr:DUF1549 and DUF1553 domain-containing protein [Pirellulales bacterium]